MKTRVSALEHRLLKQLALLEGHVSHMSSQGAPDGRGIGSARADLREGSALRRRASSGSVEGPGRERKGLLGGRGSPDLAEVTTTASEMSRGRRGSSHGAGEVRRLSAVGRGASRRVGTPSPISVPGSSSSKSATPSPDKSGGSLGGSPRSDEQTPSPERSQARRNGNEEKFADDLDVEAARPKPRHTDGSAGSEPRRKGSIGSAIPISPVQSPRLGAEGEGPAALSC